MATQTTGGGSTTSFTNTPQAQGDSYNYVENVLYDDSTLYNRTTKTIFLDVLANDLGGNAKALFSIDDGQGALTDLLQSNVSTGWEQTADKNWIRINAGKIEFKIGDGSSDITQARDVNTLGENEAVDDSFLYAIRMANGTLAYATVTIRIDGQNDLASISGTSTGDVTEDGVGGTQAFDGTLVVTDPDAGENGLQPIAAGTAGDNGYGTFQVNADGTWTYTLHNADPAVDALDDTETLTDTITLWSEDGTDSQLITVTIHGANDAPVTGGIASASGTEDDASIGGNVPAASDVDVEPLTYSLVTGSVKVDGVAAADGTVTLNSNGTYSYTPTLADQGLDTGEHRTITFDYVASDGTASSAAATVTITVNGVDDAPTLQVVTSGSISEVNQSSSTTSIGLSGTLVGADVDGETLAYGIQGGSSSGVNLVSLAGTYGTLTVNTVTGFYSYSPNPPAIEALNGGQNPSDVFTMTVSDGDAPLGTQTYTVNLTGADEAPAQAVITDIALGTGIVIPEWALLYTGVSPSGDISGVSSAVGGTVTHSPGSGTLGTVTFTDTTPAGGSFSYTTTVPVTTTSVSVSQDLLGAIDGTSGNDVIVSSNGGATLQGNAGNDALLGGSGNDTYVFGLNDGNDVITDAGSGGDQIIITTDSPLNSTSISNLNFEQTGLDLAINVGNTLIVVRDHYAGTGSQIETVTFSNGGTVFGYRLNTTGYRLSTDTTSPLVEGGNQDIIASSSVGQILNGGAANDLLFGNGGTDTINGEKGNDLIMAGDGADTIDGGDDNDTIVGQGGADSVTGGAGTDTFVLTDAATFDTITDYAVGEVIDITTLLTTAGSASGFVRFTAAGDIEIDANGGGNSYVKVAHINTGALTATVTYSTGPGTTATVVLVKGAPPIGIDMDGDGQVSFIGTDGGATFDYGYGKVATAWVAGNDGLLVRDANHDGQVSAAELVFATGGSDLQGLAAYDSNHDGQLSSADSGFADFAVWQDADGDGSVDAGEMTGLTALGIASISLSSDGIGYSAAGADVQVVGTGSFTRTDGSTGVLADAVFATGAAAQQEQKQALLLSTSNATLIGAIAAAGLVASEPLAGARDSASAQTDNNAGEAIAQHNQSLAPIAIDEPATAAAGDASTLARDASDQARPETSPFHPADSGTDHAQLDTSAAEVRTEVLQRAEAPAEDADAEASSLMAAAVAMPSAEQLGLAGVSAAAVPNHNAIVGKVLVDALNDGEHQGPSINALLSSLPHQADGPAPNAHDAVAAALAIAHDAALADYAVGHLVLAVDSLAVHQDAPPSA